MVQWHACKDQPTFLVAAYAGDVGTVSYRNHIIAIDLGEGAVPASPVDATDAFVYLSIMEDNVCLEAATLATAQTVTLTWRSVTQAPRLRGSLCCTVPKGTQHIGIGSAWSSGVLQPMN